MGSIAWAKEDGIPIVNGRFVLTCSKCGGQMLRLSYSRKRTYLCDDCKKEAEREKREAERATDGRTQSEKRFDRAVEKLKKQGIDASWDSAIKIARTRINKYDSIPEVMMAIGLIHYKYSIIPQQKVGRLHVDFAIPKRKVVVEVDGKPYHRNKCDENYRDYKIRNLLGMDWEVLHVPAEEIEKDIHHAIEFFVNKQKAPYSGDNNLF